MPGGSLFDFMAKKEDRLAAARKKGGGRLKKKREKGWRTALAGMACLAMLLGLTGEQFRAGAAWSPGQQGGAVSRRVVPLGRAVGIKLFSDGVLVVDVSALEGVGGKSPAQMAGIQEGDLLLTFNDKKIESTEHLQQLLQENGDRTASLTFRRGQENKTAEITPVCTADGAVRLGAWIRDSMAGIGTMTYYDPESGSFGALGHGITDMDTAQLMSLGSGSIMETTVKAVKKGEKGDPGELKGDFSVQRDVGTVTVNSDGGIFGTVSDSSFPAPGEPVAVASPEEVTTGRAVIRSTISGEEIREYEAEIVKVCRDEDTTRNLLLRITDPELLQATGGIVQGM